MKKAGNKGNVNIYMVWVNYSGDITDEQLVATFFNEKWALDFLRAANDNGNFDEYHYLDMRIV